MYKSAAKFGQRSTRSAAAIFLNDKRRKKGGGAGRKTRSKMVTLTSWMFQSERSKALKYLKRTSKEPKLAAELVIRILNQQGVRHPVAVLRAFLIFNIKCEEGVWTRKKVESLLKSFGKRRDSRKIREL